jgi:catechol 2,3-dioxygenase-like lactoylglutathione lyase family enzyme
MDILGLDTAILGVDDLEAAQKFCRDFGLTETERGAAGSSFESQDGTGLVLRGSRDRGLPGTTLSGSTCREAVWGVREAATLERIGAELSRDRQVARDANGVLHTVDDDGLSIAFQLSRRHDFPAEPAKINVTGCPPQRGLNRRIDFNAPVVPRSLGHIVYFSPDPTRSIKFYAQRLGFRVTDSFAENKGTFARAAGSQDHHTLFFIGNKEMPARMQHIEFHVTDFNEVMVGGKRLTDRGWQTAMGPGRHVLGSNYFWYFKTPCGGAFELGADIDYVDDKWQPHEWAYVPENTAGWRVAYQG